MRRLRAPVLFVVIAWATTAHAAADASLQAAREALARGDYAASEQALDALPAAQRGAPADLLRARLLFETGRYDEAAKLAEAASRRPGVRADAQTLRGEALEAKGQLDAADRAYRAALAADGTHLRARVLLGRLLSRRGKSAQARPYLLALIDAYNDEHLGNDRPAALAYVAMAARELGAFHDANDAFREAALADRTRVETQLEWASLFLEKYDHRHAAESVQEALDHNPNHPVARALMARLEMARSFDFPAVKEHLDAALAVNPQLVMAHVTRATMALRNMAIDEADAHLDRALAINPKDLEALSVRAAARFLADDKAGFRKATRAVLAVNPRFSRMYSIIAVYAEWEHRYEELVQMARQALAIDPEDALAYATLGQNLLREGDEKAGLEALHQAWDRDRFNVHVFNTLNLYDEVIDKEYVTFSAPPFRIRMHNEERAALEPYLVPTLRGAYEDMRRRYGFTPEGPIRLELYADAQHFSVRTTGLPNVGVQGVCFGKVITALSPRGGPFNWGQITWHELAHVFHLQLSKNHVPRWFTEGLAEYETIIARTEWHREEDHSLWQAMNRGVLPELTELNTAFTSARSPDALMTAYYLASQAVVYIVERFGFEKVRPMLEAWGKGMRTDEVLRSVLGIEPAQLDADFRAHTKQRLAHFDGQFDVDFNAYDDLPALKQAAKAHPDDPDAQAALALGYLGVEDFAAAEKAGMRAIKLSPTHPLGHFALTRVALQKRDVKRAERCLGGILKGGVDGYIVRVLLARAGMAQKRFDEARKQAEAAVALDPDQLEAYRVLLDVAEETKDKALALEALGRIVALDQHDRVAHLALMSVLHAEQRWPRLVAVGENALFVAPENPQLHRLLAEGYLQTGAPKKALAELDQALVLRHRRPGKVQLARARALLALGNKKSAREAAAEALRADPDLEPEVHALGL